MNNAVLRGDKKCPHGHTARGKCDTCDREDDQAEITRLKQELSLAEEGLANYAQENELMQKRLERIRQEHLTWATACECTCDACQTLSSIIRLSTEPQPDKHADQG